MSQSPTDPLKQDKHLNVRQRISQFQGLADSSASTGPVSKARALKNKAPLTAATTQDNPKKPLLQTELNQQRQSSHSSVRSITQQFEQAQVLKSPLTLSISPMPIHKATDTELSTLTRKATDTESPTPTRKAADTESKVSALTRQLQDQLKLFPPMQVDADAIDENRRIRAQETQKAYQKAKFKFTLRPFNPRRDAQHPYFKLLFNIQKKRLLESLDSTLFAFLQHGPTKCIIEELFKKEVAAIDLAHASLRDLSDSFDKIAMIASQYREFFLAIEAHERDPQVALPESLQGIGWLSGLITVLNVTYNNLDNETLSKIRYEIKAIYGRNFSQLPRSLPQNPSLLSDAFAIFIKKIISLTQLELNDIILAALNLDLHLETRLTAKETVLIEALRFVLTKPDCPLTNSDRRNISLNALFLYSQLATNTVTDIPLDQGQAVVVAYLLQQHRYREVKAIVDEKSEMYQRLSIIAELSSTIDNKPTPLPYSAREQIIIDLYKDFFGNDNAYLAQCITTALQAYLDTPTDNANLLTYINNIIVNAAIYHNQEKSNPKSDKLYWTALLSVPPRLPVKHDFTDSLGKKIHSAIMLLKAHHRLAKQEKGIVYKMEQVMNNIHTLEIQRQELVIKKSKSSAKSLKAIEQQICEKEAELMATHRLDNRSSVLLLLQYLTNHGVPYFQEFLKDPQIKEDKYNRVFGHAGNEFHKAHIPPKILDFLVSEDIKSVFGSTAPTGYLTGNFPSYINSTLFDSIKYTLYLQDQDTKEQNTYFITPNNRFARLDTWLRQLYRLIGQHLLTINGELRPEIVEAIGPATVAAMVEKLGTPTLISGILSSYSEFIGGYLWYQLESFTLDEQQQYVGLQSYIKRLLDPTLMEYPAADELLKITRMLVFIYEISAIEVLSKQIEKVNRLAEEIYATVYSQALFNPKATAILFSKTFDLIAAWNFSDTSNNKYEVFLVKHKDILLDWLNSNIEELSHPAIHKRYISIIDPILEQFFQQFSGEYASYCELKALPVFQSNTDISFEQADSSPKLKQQRRMVSLFQGTVTSFNSESAATTSTSTDTVSSIAPSLHPSLGNNHAGQ